MLEFKISTQPATIISFDGRIIEIFWTTSRQGGRFHVFQIVKIWIETDKHGTHTLNFNSKYVNEILVSGLTTSESALAQAQELVLAVQQAMALYL